MFAADKLNVKKQEKEKLLAWLIDPLLLLSPVCADYTLFFLLRTSKI